MYCIALLYSSQAWNRRNPMTLRTDPSLRTHFRSPQQTSRAIGELEELTPDRIEFLTAHLTDLGHQLGAD